MLDATELARRLREAMGAEKMRPVDLARETGESPQAVNSWLKTGRIAKGKLARVATAVRRPLWYFLIEDLKKGTQTMNVADLAVQLGLSEEELMQAAYAAAEVKKAMKPREPAGRKKGGR